jgi:hypothetical protein
MTTELKKQFALFGLLKTREKWHTSLNFIQGTFESYPAARKYLDLNYKELHRSFCHFAILEVLNDREHAS